ncbi:hypothetical protein G9298_28135 (plasmid) [Bacillus thuringiensis]|nr:hypothetical protein G9298_28135 [Bacillus thuringiensis]
MVHQYVAEIRSVLIEKGKPLFQLPGMHMYEQTEAIQQSIETCISHFAP